LRSTLDAIEDFGFNSSSGRKISFAYFYQLKHKNSLNIDVAD